MLNHTSAKKQQIILFLATTIQLTLGITAFYFSNWMKMSMFLGSAFIVGFAFIMRVPILKLDICFRWFEKHISEISDSTRFPSKLPSNSKAIRNKNDIIEKITGFFMVISTTTHFCLGIFVGLNENWFELGTLMISCIFIYVVCIGVLFTIKIDTRFCQIEKLVYDCNANHKSEEKFDT